MASIAFVASGGGITIGGQTRYRSRQALAVDNTLITSRTSPIQDWHHDPRRRTVPEQLLAVRRTDRLGEPSKKFAIGVYGNNLINKAYKTDAQEFSSIGNIRTVYYGAPRTVMLRLTARY